MTSTALLELLPPRTTSNIDLRPEFAATPVWLAPAVIRSRGSYWHIPRCGSRRRNRTSWHSWCGQILYASRCITRSEPPSGESLCATCAGRAKGIDPDSGWIFTPRWMTPPAVCPGSGKAADFQGDYTQTACRCLFCGAMVGTWTNKLRKHAPGDLCEPCVWHGWCCLYIRNGEVACSFVSFMDGAA